MSYTQRTSKVGRKYVVWEESDFVKHGFIATYELGKCRCDVCTERWDKWVEDAPMPKGPVPEGWDIMEYTPYGL